MQVIIEKKRGNDQVIKAESSTHTFSRPATHPRKPNTVGVGFWTFLNDQHRAVEIEFGVDDIDVLETMLNNLKKHQARAA